jgi:hypothetical protein
MSYFWLRRGLCFCTCQVHAAWLGVACLIALRMYGVELFLRFTCSGLDLELQQVLGLVMHQINEWLPASAVPCT